VATFAVLPLSLVLLRRGARTRLKKFLFVSCIGLLTLTGSALLILWGLRLGVFELEWRGGYVPVLTARKTKADFDALDRSRAAQNQLAVPALPGARAAANWPGFRGANRDGASHEAILTDWPREGLRRLWRQPCGGGYSSFALVEDRAFTLEQRRELEVAVAYDIGTGRELWTNAWPARFTEYHSDEGPRSTPTYDEGKIYVFGATGEFRCLAAASGAVIWAKNIVTENASKPPPYGVVSSPLVVGDRIVVHVNGLLENSVACYDKHDGKMLWSALKSDIGYASPALITLEGEQQVIICTRPYTVGLRLEDGAERWRFHWAVLGNERPVTQPLLLDSNRFFLSAAYMTGCTAVDVNRVGEVFQATALWRTRSLKTKFASAVLWQGFVYGLDEDILVCVDAQTGERKWKDGRYGYGQILLASGHLVIQCADGDLALVKATPDKWDEVARVRALRGKSWNVPALGGGRLLVRNGAEMACYEIGATQTVRAEVSQSGN
jgi:outer membrane protein assembly factor BamB